MKAILIAAAAMALVACGGSTDSNPKPDVSGMWASAGGVLTCTGTDPQIDGTTAFCGWTCVEVDGTLYSAIGLHFAKDGAEWTVQAENWLAGDCH